MSKLKVSPMTFGLMVARLALEYDIDIHVGIADQSGDGIATVCVQTDAQRVAAEFAQKMGTIPRLEDLGVEVKYQRSGEKFLGMPYKIWEVVT